MGHQPLPLQLSTTGRSLEELNRDSLTTESRRSREAIQSHAWPCLTISMEMVLNGTMLLATTKNPSSVKTWRDIWLSPGKRSLILESHKYLLVLVIWLAIKKSNLFNIFSQIFRLAQEYAEDAFVHLSRLFNYLFVI